MNIIKELLNEKKMRTIDQVFDKLSSIFTENQIKSIDSVSLNIFDKEFIEEIKSIPENVTLSFGKNLHELKCTIIADESLRAHEIFLKYNVSHKLSISSVNLPYSHIQECEYATIAEVVLAFQQYITSLSAYFHELECIDETFTVVEPIRPTFKDDYRRISLDERTWLHIEVSVNGSASNVHLVGQSEYWHNKLQAGLLAWDHDKDIAENILFIFDLNKTSFIKPMIISTNTKSENNRKIEIPSCAICFCIEIPDNSGLPQPLCQNLNCGVYYHRSCLYQWLVACEGGRLPAFGVANGSCPTCLQPLTCSEKDN